MIEIRSLRREELGLLRKVAIETYVETFAPFNTAENMDAFLKEAYSSEQLERDWQEEGSIYYVAWDAQEPLGFARLRRSDEVEKQLGKNAIELHRLYVHPDHQGKKVGALLIKKSFAYALENGFDWIWLGVWERNFKAQVFYGKWGFEKFGEHIFQMGDDPQNDWMLKKKLK